MYKKLLTLLLLLPCELLFAQAKLLTGFPKGSTAYEVGKRLAYHFVDSRHELYAGKYMHLRWKVPKTQMHRKRLGQIKDIPWTSTLSMVWRRTPEKID